MGLLLIVNGNHTSCTHRHAGQLSSKVGDLWHFLVQVSRQIVHKCKFVVKTLSISELCCISITANNQSQPNRTTPASEVKLRLGTGIAHK